MTDEELLVQLRELRDMEEIKQLKARYVQYVDTQDWTAWADEVLADDVRFESDGDVQDGRDGVVEMVSGALTGQSTVHHVLSPEITITGPATATGIWAMEDWVRMSRNAREFAFHGCGH